MVTEPVPISNEIYLVGRFAAQRAFFYAGGRSLLVSHWEVETNSAVALMTGTFVALAANPQLSHGEALRQSMLAMINHPQQPNLVEPKYWAPFVVVGEPAKPTP